jgi:hypothetical protein
VGFCPRIFDALASRARRANRDHKKSIAQSRFCRTDVWRRLAKIQARVSLTPNFTRECNRCTRTFRVARSFDRHDCTAQAVIARRHVAEHVMRRPHPTFGVGREVAVNLPLLAQPRIEAAVAHEVLLEPQGAWVPDRQSSQVVDGPRPHLPECRLDLIDQKIDDIAWPLFAERAHAP